MAAKFIEAVKSGDRATVDRMLDADPSLASAKDEGGTSAVLLAHYYGKADIAQALLSRGPALDVFEASTAGDAKRVVELVDGDRALANAVAHDGYSPLGLAAFFNHRDAVKALLERGAKPSTPSRDQGFTPLHSAVATDAGAIDHDIVRLLLEAGADPNATSREGGTPLHTAAFTGDVEVAELLLAYGADPSATDKKGRTALDLARDQKNVEVAALLHHSITNRGRIQKTR
ncbi:MAG TPA: ankyrin repeat domain-containing protein [Candidatus Limnocylindria bacterium]|nr:ankyrin repeat domain-containing protein [Candidatus Limnocylindria bacterium]